MRGVEISGRLLFPYIKMAVFPKVRLRPRAPLSTANSARVSFLQFFAHCESHTDSVVVLTFFRAFVVLILWTISPFEAIPSVDAIECYVYKHVDDLAAIGVDRSFSKTVECPTGVNSCLQWKGYYPLESHPVHGFKKVFYDGGCGPREDDMWYDERFPFDPDLYYSNVFSCRGNAYTRAKKCVAEVDGLLWVNGTNGTMNGTDVVNVTVNGGSSSVMQTQEVLPMTTDELCTNVTQAVIERERNKEVLEVLMNVFLKENPVIANYLWLVFGDAFAAEMSHDLASTAAVVATQKPTITASDDTTNPLIFSFQNEEEDKEPSKFDEPITDLVEEEYSEEVLGARKLLEKIKGQMTILAEIDSVRSTLYPLYASDTSKKYMGAASADYHKTIETIEHVAELMKRAGYRKLIRNLNLWGNGTHEWGMVPYNQTTLLQQFFIPSSASRPNSMQVIPAADGTQKVDSENALKTDFWIDAHQPIPATAHVHNFTLLQQLVPLSDELVSHSEEYFAANYSTYTTSSLYQKTEYFANPIFMNDQMNFLGILSDVLNETDILGNLDAGSFVGQPIPKTKLQKRAEQLKVHFQNFDEFLIGQYCFEWEAESEMRKKNSMGAAYQEMMSPDVRFGILQTMFENDTYTYNYPEKAPCGDGQILEVYAREEENTNYWDQWQTGKWQGLLVDERGQLKTSQVKKKDQVLALSGYKSKIHRFNITRQLSFYPYTDERAASFTQGTLRARFIKKRMSRENPPTQSCYAVLKICFAIFSKISK